MLLRCASQVLKRRRQLFRLPELREEAADGKPGQLAGDLVLAAYGDENDADAGVDLSDRLRQPDAAQPLRPKLNLGQQYVAALGLGKGKSLIGMVEAMQLCLRDDLRKIQLHFFQRIYVVVHMDDLHGITSPDNEKRAATGGSVPVGEARD